MKQFDIITIFPHILDSYLNESLFKRAQKNKIFKKTFKKKKKPPPCPGGAKERYYILMTKVNF